MATSERKALEARLQRLATVLSSMPPSNTAAGSIALERAKRASSVLFAWRRPRHPSSTRRQDQRKGPGYRHGGPRVFSTVRTRFSGTLLRHGNRNHRLVHSRRLRQAPDPSMRPLSCRTSSQIRSHESRCSSPSTLGFHQREPAVFPPLRDHHRPYDLPIHMMRTRLRLVA